MFFFFINTVLLGRDDDDAPEQSEREPFMYPVPYSFVCLCVRACVRVCMCVHYNCATIASQSEVVLVLLILFNLFFFCIFVLLRRCATSSSLSHSYNLTHPYHERQTFRVLIPQGGGELYVNL